MVCGSRFRGDPGYKVPIGRRIGNLIFSVVLTVICRQRITDPTSGFRMTNRRGIELFARDYPHDYPEVEAILMLHAHRLRIHEVPVRMNARGFGRSSIDYPRSAYYMAKVLLALFVGLFRRRPTPVEATGRGRAGGAAGPGRRHDWGLRRMIALPLAASHAVGTKAQIVAVIVAGDLPGGCPRAGPPPPAGRALRPAVDDRRGGDAGARGVARRAEDARRRGRGRTRLPTRCSWSRSASCSSCSSTSRSPRRGSPRRPRSWPRRSPASMPRPRQPGRPPPMVVPRPRRRSAAMVA